MDYLVKGCWTAFEGEESVCALLGLCRRGISERKRSGQGGGEESGESNGEDVGDLHVDGI